MSFENAGRVPVPPAAGCLQMTLYDSPLTRSVLLIGRSLAWDGHGKLIVLQLNLIRTDSLSERRRGLYGDKMQKSLERMAEMLLKVNDRSRSSMERLTQSIEKQAAAYGKTGIERLIAERDRLIKKLGDEQGMV